MDRYERRSAGIQQDIAEQGLPQFKQSLDARRSAHNMTNGQWMMFAGPEYYSGIADSLMKQGHSPVSVADVLGRYQSVYGVDLQDMIKQYQGLGQGAPSAGQGEDTTQYNAGG